MKHVIFQLLLYFIALPALAQPEDIPTFEISFCGGATHYSESAKLNNYPKQPGTVGFDYPRYESGWLTSGNYALHLGYWLNGQIGIGLGWSLGSRGGTLHETFEFEDVHGEQTTHTTIQTWDFPFALTYRFLRTDLITLEVSSGIEYSVGLEGFASSSLYYYPPEDRREDRHWEVRNLDDNIALSSDAVIKLWPIRSVGFLLGFGYSHGLTQLKYSIDHRTTRNFRVYTGITILPAYPSE